MNDTPIGPAPADPTPDRPPLARRPTKAKRLVDIVEADSARLVVDDETGQVVGPFTPAYRAWLAQHGGQIR